MATDRNPLFASPYNSDLEHLPILEPGEESGDDEICIDLSSISTFDPKYFPLKMALLQSLLDECISTLKSAERKYRCRTMASSTSLFAAGGLIFAGAIMANVLPQNTYHKKGFAFRDQYNSIDIPTNTSEANYSCADVGVMRYYNSSFYGRTHYELSIADPMNTCPSIDRFSNNTDGFLAPIDPLIPQQLKAAAWNICLEALLELCKEFNKNNPSYKNNLRYYGLIVLVPCFLVVTAVALGIVGGVSAYHSGRSKKKVPAVGKQLFAAAPISSEEQDRMLDIFRVFNLAIPDRTESIENLIARIQDVKGHLTNVEVTHFLEKRLFPKKLSGFHHFFSEIKELAIPDLSDRPAAEESVKGYWSAARKANIFQR